MKKLITITAYLWLKIEICRTIVNWNPDLVFLTGDFTTIESYFEPEKLAYGFAPLKELPGKLFACLGVCILLPFDLSF